VVPEQDLDGPQVGAGLEQVSREAVPQRLNTLLILRLRRRSITDTIPSTTPPAASCGAPAAEAGKNSSSSWRMVPR
jgi:hypothetical protein